MPNVLRPSTVIRQITTETVQGEVTVNLNLTLTLHIDQSGDVSMNVSTTKPAETPDYVPQIPDWDDGDLIEFGKEVKQ
jgi:hypothetical protein